MSYHYEHFAKIWQKIFDLIHCETKEYFLFDESFSLLLKDELYYLFFFFEFVVVFSSLRNVILIIHTTPYELEFSVSICSALVQDCMYLAIRNA